MSGETIITLVGNLTSDPELRFTKSGAPYVSFTVASTPRTFDRNTNEWRDGETLFLNCSAWREMAENITDSLRKGTRVIVQGRLTSRSYETQNGERRTVNEIQVEEIGPSLRRATAQVTRNQGGGQGGYSQGGGFGQGGQQAPQGGYGAPQSQGNNGGYGAPAGGAAEDPWGSVGQGTASFDAPPPF